MTSHCQNTQTPAASGALIRLLALGLLLAALLAGAVWYQQALAPAEGIRKHDCNLQQGPCQVALENGSLHLQAGPLPLRSLSPFKLELTLEGVEANRVTADLQGAEMYMGINRFELQPDAARHWLGETELAVCTTGTMLWRLTLEIDSPQGPIQHLFEFEAR